MRELLTPALAGVNPKAYTAHFKRLQADEQRQYLKGLQVDELKAHFKTIGENATVGLFLTVEPESFRLEATVGGATLGEASGLECLELQARAISIGTAIEAKVVSGMLVSAIQLLPQTEKALQALRWEPKTLVLAGDSGGGDAAPSLGWSMRGSIGAVAEPGTFYMPTQPLLWGERSVIEERLRELSARTGAVLDVRLG